MIYTTLHHLSKYKLDTRNLNRQQLRVSFN